MLKDPSSATDKIFCRFLWPGYDWANWCAMLCKVIMAKHLDSPCYVSTLSIIGRHIMSLLLLLLGGPFCVKLLRPSYLVCHDVSLLVSLLGAPCNIITFVTTWCSMLWSSSYVWATWWAILCDHLFHYLVSHIVSLLLSLLGAPRCVTTWWAMFCQVLIIVLLGAPYCVITCVIAWCAMLCHYFVSHIVSLLVPLLVLP